jgi:hypothetical protein
VGKSVDEFTKNDCLTKAAKVVFKSNDFLQIKGLAYIVQISFAYPSISICFITWLPAIKASMACWFIYFAC